MVTTKEITKNEWLELYSRKELQDPITRILPSGEVRYYGSTVLGASSEPNGYIVVWAKE